MSSEELSSHRSPWGGEERGRQGGSPRCRVAHRLTGQDRRLYRLGSSSPSARGSAAAGGKFPAGLRGGGAVSVQRSSCSPGVTDAVPAGLPRPSARLGESCL